MDFSYVLTPFLVWLVAGATKFLVNSVRMGRPAFDLIGYGGMPSNHSAIVSSMAALIAFKEGIDRPAFGIALTLAFIVVLDAGSLRRHVGSHAAAINRLTSSLSVTEPLRERLGHTRAEIAAGVALGIAVAATVSRLIG